MAVLVYKKGPVVSRRMKSLPQTQSWRHIAVALLELSGPDLYPTEHLFERIGTLCLSCRTSEPELINALMAECTNLHNHDRISLRIWLEVIITQYYCLLVLALDVQSSGVDDFQSYSLIGKKRKINLYVTVTSCLELARENKAAWLICSVCYEDRTPKLLAELLAKGLEKYSIH